MSAKAHALLARGALRAGCALLVAVAAASAAAQDEDAELDRALAKAASIDGLGPFLENALGDCEEVTDPGFDKASCQEAARRARERWANKPLSIRVEDLQGKLTSPKWDPRRKAYRVLWTPIFGARGLGLTVGHPKRLDAAGNPVIERRALWVQRPNGVPEFIFRRDLERGMVHMDLLVELEGPWRLRRRRGPDVRGLAVELRGFRLSTRRDVLAEHMYRR